MKLALKFSLGLFACLALTLLATGAVRAQDTYTGNSSNNPAVTSPENEPATEAAETTAAAQTAAATAEQSPEEKAQKAAECESMGMPAGHRHLMEGREMSMTAGPGMAEMMGMPLMADHVAMMRMISRNPKMAGHMLEMRADMMRAVADVMNKYAKQMESGDWQSFQTSSAGSD
jgi:hypothetical protein